MQRWFVSSLSEIVIQWFWRKSDKRMKCFIHHLNMWYYMYIQFLQLHICHLRSYYKIKQRYTYIEFSRTFQILHHNMFKTLAYSSNITQNGSCIRNLPSLTLKTFPTTHPTPRSLSMNFPFFPPNSSETFGKNTTPWILSIKYLQLLINLIHNLTKFLHTQTIHSTITWESL